MKKLVYVYSDGKEFEHTKFISDKTILKEANGADRVAIYKCNEYELEQRQDGYVAGEYITTKLLK
nr:MAG TPA: hypothetical protein [Caudoviricetes sp.]